MSHADEVTDTGAASDTGTSKVRIENVDKHFGRIVALEDITLDIGDGEILAMVGDNGAGKSTLMKVLCGVHEPTNGTIYVDGQAVSFSNPDDARRYGIETVYQDLALMDDLDVATNIYMDQFPTRGFGPLSIVDWDETYRKAERLLDERLDRDDIDAHTEVEFLSGGERQLVAIARALAFDPDLVILDEPTSALSVEATELVHETVRQLRAEGITVVIVSHSLDEIFGLADRIAVLYQGRLVDVADPTKVDRDALVHMMSTGTRPE
ncbi:ATP-binding cassette domain-containing protein [Halopelagius longus]|uniref:Monosaccharide ABC transporter ATP-binding protein, CUT2 family n=1 Tax=Halopelagius longus TaxID=1236180 RepID=A0A1H1FC52_9EURY|nr:ATP-binding cassette domain-containing protein [Halopelagius longus]RDI70173.1 sugar ABC transporter ATP-binding protein [Halopelagius longus]SDQ98490.1 monosaccharide ABC transporter ATP-binding protein, CUT2 family [Halopelagius longus]